MSSESGRRGSPEEPGQLNRPQAPEETPETHPTAEEWGMLMACVSAQYRVTAALYDWMKGQPVRVDLYSMERQVRNLTQEVAAVRQALERAGEKRERRFLLPRLSLPHIPLPQLDRPEWICLLLVLPVGLALFWFSWGRLWSALAG